MRSVRLSVYDERRGRFAKLRGANVLIYFPHGLGDWAHLSTIVPYLEASNRYAITRYGDDYVALMEGNPIVTPVYTGVYGVSDGSDAGARHFGIDFRRINGKPRVFNVPRLEYAFERMHFDAVLYTDYPEREGRTRFPFHTKARALLRDLVEPKSLDLQALARPLQSTISFDVPAHVQHAVDDRLRTFVSRDERLLLLTPSGHTAERKNWDPQHVERLREIADRNSPRWRTLDFGEQFGDLFGGIRVPFGLLLKALLHRTDLVIGVPAGPLHVALGYGSIPVAGIWLAHHPDWYEERKEHAIHLIGKTVLDKRYDRRPATASLPQELRNRTVFFAHAAQIAADDVWQAAQELLR